MPRGSAVGPGLRSKGREAPGRSGHPRARSHHHLDVPVVDGDTTDVGRGLPVGDALLVQLAASQDEAWGDGGSSLPAAGRSHPPLPSTSASSPQKQGRAGRLPLRPHSRLSCFLPPAGTAAAPARTQHAACMEVEAAARREACPAAPLSPEPPGRAEKPGSCPAPPTAQQGPQLAWASRGHLRGPRGQGTHFRGVARAGHGCACTPWCWPQRTAT